MRALAHPLRVALLEAMRRDGEITATRAAELLGESPGNKSWHLQTLAKYCFVEETGEGRGRSRPWRLTSDSRSFETRMTDPDVAAAGEALERTFIDRIRPTREWWSRRSTYPVKWRRAAFMTDTVSYLTAARTHRGEARDTCNLHPLRRPRGQGRATSRSPPRPPLRTRAPPPTHSFGELKPSAGRHQALDDRRPGTCGSLGRTIALAPEIRIAP
jgi:DNA-binding transcriptional ArsR family regulator